MRRFLRITLQGHGYRLTEAATGQEGLTQAATRNPDVVLLDLGLPDMDGLEVTKRLRAWSQVPVIVLSAREQEDDKIRALDSGADDYLTKPFGQGASCTNSSCPQACGSATRRQRRIGICS